MAKIYNICAIFKATKYAINGLCKGITTERALAQEVILLAILIPLSFWLGNSSIEIVLLNIPLFLLLITELLNTALEKTIDRISTQQHPLAGYAKDLAAAAVLVSLLLVCLVWVVLLLEKFS
jgi:diacylglycerol kinase (ATP)